MTPATATTAAALLERAAVLIATRGLHQAYQLVGPDGSLCPDGAICAAALEAAGKTPTAALIGRYYYSPVGYSIVGSTLERTRHAAQRALRQHLAAALADHPGPAPCVQTWAMEPGRRAADVVEMLQGAAASEVSTNPRRTQ